MSEPQSGQQYDASDKTRAVIPTTSSFRFESGSVLSPIRFNPDASSHSRIGNSRSSSSSLSSTVTLGPTTLTIKSTNRPATQPKIGDSYTDEESGSITPGGAFPSIPVMHTSQPQASANVFLEESALKTANSPPKDSAPYQAPTNGVKPPGKLTTQYVMPDGTVITGKGLGRGRPGVKRGPRRSKLPGEEQFETTPPATTPVPQASATPVGGKRKREESDTLNIRARSASSSSHLTESSVEYNPTATQTRSGRQTQKPMPLVTQVTTPIATSSPSMKKVSAPMTATPALKSHPKIKRKVYRGKEQLALCEHCLRGFGPVGNVIVFCDACNKCWHQRCHHPQIPKELIADSKAEWFCTTCDKILHGNKKGKKPPPKLEVASMPPPQQKFGPPLIGAIALTLEQRKKYLDTLSHNQLVNLVLRAGELAPQMPIFETPIPIPRPNASVQPQFTSNYVTPVMELPHDNKAGAIEIPDEGYDDSYDEHAALYPKVGEGAQLPPEREDLNMLLEGPDSRTFSHWVKGLPVKTVIDTVPLHQSQFQAPKS